MELNVEALDRLPMKPGNAASARARCCLTCIFNSVVYVSAAE
ncbi:hypothetical protein [Actinomadura luzonensis]|nr:hypothetical protein [Actinomadura luzonensis]